MQNKADHRQAFFFTLINYVGILIGIFSTLFVYPKNKEMLGVFRYVESLAQVLFPIMLLGVSQVLIKFGPKLDKYQEKQLFNYSVLSILFMSFLVLIAIGGSSLFSVFKHLDYVYLAFSMGLFLAFIDLFKKQATIIQKISVPTFFDNIVPKLALPAIFLLVLNNCVSSGGSLVLYAISYGLIALFVAVYLFCYFKPVFRFDFKSLFTQIDKKEMYRFSLFAFAGSLGSVFAFRIDAIMIPKFISMEANGSFSIGVTLASALAIPATGIFTLYAPIISNFIKNDMMEELNLKYKEISKLLFFIGAILYSCIFLGIENLFMLLPTHENLMASVSVILILGFNVLVNMGTGFNGEIITYSKYYQFNVIAILVLVILNVTLNILFINVFHMGIEGVAFASLIAMVLFNLSKLIFIYQKFKLFPFDQSYLKLVVVFSAVLLCCYFLPNLQNNWLNLICKTGLSMLLNLGIIYKLNLVYSYNFWVNKMLAKLKSK
ncbi:MATE family efflux transporter [Flavobacterium flavipallidum]|uniref:Polysaccharide biosynthesis C-terminal domain-containing protein n=1 Tax=Flavobacterium flavipallidum TaxID=3139140 RepID=A0ABU9HRG4_9FLAO